MYPRTVAEALVLQEVSEEELRSLRTASDDIVCFDGDANPRIRWCAGPAARVTKHGMTGWCSVVSVEAQTLPQTPVRVHFCSSFPCTAIFDGLGTVEIPRYHVRALRRIARDCDGEKACIGIMESGAAHNEGVSTPSTPKAPALSALAEPPALALPAPAEPLPNETSPIAMLSQDWTPSFKYVGLFAFLTWGIENQKEVRVWLWENQFVDLVATWAPWVHGADSSVCDWPRVQVVACKMERVGKSECVSVRMVQGPGQLHEINHYMPLVAAPGGRRTLRPQHPACNGALCNTIGDYCMAAIIPQTLRFGAIPFRSVSDGNCAFDTMLFHTGRQRTELARRSMRLDVTKAMRKVAGDCDWEEACLNIEGHVATSHEGACAASTPSALVEPQPKAPVIPVISEPPAHKIPSPPQPDPPQPDPVFVPDDVDLPALAEHLSSAASPATSAHDGQPNLDASILKKLGLKRLNCWESKLLLKALSPEVKKGFEEASAQVSSEKGSKAAQPSGVGLSRKDERFGTKRKHSELVATYAAKRGVVSSVGKDLPRNFWKGFAEEVCKDNAGGKGLTRKQKMYWSRRLRSSEASSSRLRLAVTSKRRTRTTGKQGRPISAPCIEEELVKWFAGVRRRGGRVT